MLPGLVPQKSCSFRGWCFGSEVCITPCGYKSACRDALDPSNCAAIGQLNACFINGRKRNSINARSYKPQAGEENLLRFTAGGHYGDRSRCRGDRRCGEKMLQSSASATVWLSIQRDPASSATTVWRGNRISASMFSSMEALLDFLTCRGRFRTVRRCRTAMFSDSGLSSYRAAACAEPLAVALHTVTRAGDVLGRRVLVTGCGPIGVLAVAAARLAGAGEIVSNAKNLLAVEDAFCQLKSYLEVRPVFHSHPDRVRNHVRLCFIAYWLCARLGNEWRAKGEKGEVQRLLRQLQAIR